MQDRSKAPTRYWYVSLRTIGEHYRWGVLSLEGEQVPLGVVRGGEPEALRACWAHYDSIVGVTQDEITALFEPFEKPHIPVYLDRKCEYCGALSGESCVNRHGTNCAPHQSRTCDSYRNSVTSSRGYTSWDRHWDIEELHSEGAFWDSGW